MKKLSKFLIIAGMMVSMAFVSCISAFTEDSVTELHQAMTTVNATVARQEPDANAAEAFSFDAGVTLYVSGMTSDGAWYRATFRGVDGYVPKNDLQPADLQLSAFNDEMAKLEAEGKAMIEKENAVPQENEGGSKIWIVIIIIIVILLVGTGVYFGLFNKKIKIDLSFLKKGRTPGKRKKKEDDDIVLVEDKE